MRSRYHVQIKKATSEIDKKYASQIAAKQKQYDECIMSKRALAFGFGGYADLDLTFGEFFARPYACGSVYAAASVCCSWPAAGRKRKRYLRVRRGR